MTTDRQGGQSSWGKGGIPVRWHGGARRSKSVSVRIGGLAEFALYAFFFVVFLGSLPNNLTQFSLSIDTPSAEGNALTQAAFLLLFAVALVSLMLGRGGKLMPLPLPVLATIGWCWISLAWAAYPDIALRRVILLTIVAYTVFALVRRVGAERSFQILCHALAWTILLDLLAVVIVPGGTQTDSEAVNAWKGFHNDKNAAGAVVGPAVLVLGCRAALCRRPAEFGNWLLMAVLALSFLYMSQSKTSLGLVPVSTAFGLLIVLALRWRGMALASAIAATAAGLLVYTSFDDLAYRLTLMMDDPTALTGRTQIWPLLGYVIDQNWWLGSGYGSFWAVGAEGGFNVYATGWLVRIPNAHNGYLDMTVQTGVIGASLAVFAAFVYPLVRLAIRRSALKGHEIWVVAAVLCFALLHNFLETSLFDRANALWVITMTVIAIAYAAADRHVRV